MFSMSLPPHGAMLPVVVGSRSMACDGCGCSNPETEGARDMEMAGMAAAGAAGASSAWGPMVGTAKGQRG
jgi:hypothetical protein